MNNLATAQSQNRQENIVLEEFQPPVGEGYCQYNEQHTLFLSLAPRPVSLLHIQDGKTSTGLYKKGDMLITPAQTRLFARWESQDHYVQIRLNSHFIERIAQETFDQETRQLELIPQSGIRDSQMEAIAMMLYNEWQQKNNRNQLYLDSLTNLLAVNLLRHYTTKKAQLSVYQGGLPQHQLTEVLDYIDSHLQEELKLADFAKLLDLSQFHFSRLFKQSLGISPYQYLLQQRVEKAKRLLKQTDQFIVDIALECGFNSHSHLTKQFRQLTGMTPKTYRAN